MNLAADSLANAPGRLKVAQNWGDGPHGKMPAMGLDHYRKDRVGIGMLNRAQLKRLLVEAINRLDAMEREMSGQSL